MASERAVVVHVNEQGQRLGEPVVSRFVQTPEPKAETLVAHPETLKVKIGSLELEVEGQGPAMLYDTKKLLIDGKPFPPFRALKIEASTDSPIWIVTIEYYPQ